MVIPSGKMRDSRWKVILLEFQLIENHPTGFQSVNEYRIPPGDSLDLSFPSLMGIAPPL